MRRQYSVSQQRKSSSHIYLSTKQAKMAGLQSRMAISYVWVTAILIFTLEILVLIGLSLILFLVIAPFVYTLEAQQVTQHYVLAASLQANSAALNPQSTFQAGQAGTLTQPGQSNSSAPISVPYIAAQAPDTRILPVALLIAPDGSILASSYPQRYPLHTFASSLLPSRGSLILRALMGTEGSEQETTLAESSVYTVAPVWSRQMHPIGAIYVQITNLPSVRDSITRPTPWHGIFLIGALALLVILPPISGLFGMLTTRGLIRRILLLVQATSHFADGDYTQRVHVGNQDEIGQLEHHFNHMALQLAESIQQQQVLTEQNARLAERARISRDLHDSVKQQVFALAAQIGAALTLFDHKSEETRTHLETASELAYQVRQELTTLIQELRLSIREKNFDQALRDNVESWSRQNNIPVDIQLQNVPLLPPNSVARELLQVVQEALSNIARHSQATHVQFSLKHEQTQIIITITDNGHGFDRKTVSSQSMGLLSMQERLEEIDGLFQLQSNIGQGTQIKVYYPRSQHNSYKKSDNKTIDV